LLTRGRLVSGRVIDDLPLFTIDLGDEAKVGGFSLSLECLQSLLRWRESGRRDFAGVVDEGREVRVIGRRVGSTVRGVKRVSPSVSERFTTRGLVEECDQLLRMAGRDDEGM